LSAFFSLQKLSETLMYIVPIAWIYVALMMSVAEATSSNGTVLGAVITFVLYGLLPVGLVLYIMGTPGRKRMLRARQEQERAAWQAQATANAAQSLTGEPNTGGHAATDTVAPVGKEP
jgi:hypothetical protein